MCVCVSVCVSVCVCVEANGSGSDRKFKKKANSIACCVTFPLVWRAPYQDAGPAVVVGFSGGFCESEDLHMLPCRSRRRRSTGSQRRFMPRFGRCVCVCVCVSVCVWRPTPPSRTRKARRRQHVTCSHLWATSGLYNAAQESRHR